MSPKSQDAEVITVVVETPRGSRNKFKFDPDQQAFTLASVLPAGAVFPYDFGFVPGTQADDGDPIDVLLLMDVAAFPGCRLKARLIGVIEAEQTEDGKTVRNDRLLAVAVEAHDYHGLETPDDIHPHLLKELEHFFVSYNEMKGKGFTVLGVHGPKRASKLLKEAKK